MDRELGHKLINKLYHSGNLNENEYWEQRNKLDRLIEIEIEDFLRSLQNSEFFCQN